MNRKSSKDKRMGGIFIVLCFITLLLILSVGKRGFIQQFRIRQERERLRHEIDSLQVSKKLVEDVKENLNDPEQIEKIAREEYGMARKNEKVYRVVPKQEK